MNLRDRSGETVRADLLLFFWNEKISTTVAMEIKSQLPVQPKNYRDTFFQAFKYVGAEVIDPRCPKTCVNFSIVKPDRPRWVRPRHIIDIKINEVIASSEMDGIELSFNTLGVGVLLESPENLNFKFCSNSVWDNERGWKTEFERRGFFTALV